jgi:hypothetical protein
VRLLGGADELGEVHSRYDEPEGVLAHRLATVKRLIRGYVDARVEGEVRILSPCAGDGRDILGVLETHAVRERARGRLIELEPVNGGAARQHARGCRPEGDRGRHGRRVDHGCPRRTVPADLVLVCGVFGNIVDEDVRATIEALPQFCARGALVIWTRHRREPELTPAIRTCFHEAGFAERAFDSVSPEGAREPNFPAAGVGAHTWGREPKPLQRGRQLFTFFR